MNSPDAQRVKQRLADSNLRVVPCVNTQKAGIGAAPKILSKLDRSQMHCRFTPKLLLLSMQVPPPPIRRRGQLRYDFRGLLRRNQIPAPVLGFFTAGVSVMTLLVAAAFADFTNVTSRFLSWSTFVKV